MIGRGLQSDAAGIRLKVTGRDIAEGVRGSRRACPICRAAWRRWGRHCRAFVGGESLTVMTGGAIREYPLGQAARRFVESFDEGGMVMPGEYRFDAPRVMAADLTGRGRYAR